jgi:predicted outer membrane repeat protein
MRTRTTTVLAAAALLSGAAHAQTTWTVPSPDTPTLAFALNTAVSPVQPGDAIELTDAAFYLEPYVVETADLTIRGAAGQDITIDALGQGTVFEVLADNLTLQDLTITGGLAAIDGGGVRAIAQSVTAIDCVFIDNEAPDDAGALVVSDGVLTLIGCRFENNRTLNTTADSNGGAIQAVRVTGLIRGCEFIGNIAGDFGGAIQFATSSDIDVEGCRFEGNSTQEQGGGAVLWSGSSAGLVSDTTFIDNTADRLGGAIYSADSWPDFLRCKIIENMALEDGGGVYVGGETSEEVEFFSCLIAGNTAAVTGGGIQAQTGPDVNAFNCTIVDNVAVEAGGGVYDFGSGAGTQLFNCILRGNAPEQFQNDGPGSYFYCNVQDIEMGFGVGNIDADPMFADADGDDNDPMTFEDNGYALLPGSPSIDAGDSTQITGPMPLDLAMENRAVDDPATADTGAPVFFQTVDQGAYEYQPPTSPAPTGCKADINGDGATDVFDFAELADDFGCEDNPD